MKKIFLILTLLFCLIGKYKETIEEGTILIKHWYARDYGSILCCHEVALDCVINNFSWPREKSFVS